MESPEFVARWAELWVAWGHPNLWVASEVGAVL